MNLLKNVLGRVFAFWALIVFVPTMLIAFIPIWLAGFWPEPVRTKIFQTASATWMRVFFFFTGTRLLVKGKEHFEKNKNYVVVCNHNSFMDVPITTPFIPGPPNKTIAKIEIAKVPVFGLIYKRGSVLVNRKSEESRKASISKMKEVLNMGLHMCIYPEGTRNKTNEPLQKFHDGAFRLAIDTGKPILPTVIFNTAKVLPVGKPFFFWPVAIRMHYLKPVAVDSTMTVASLRDKVFTIMKDYYVANR
jgi:1-acyl-sn-glycerol-3-phosphate acyltransferase